MMIKIIKIIKKIKIKVWEISPKKGIFLKKGKKGVFPGLLLAITMQAHAQTTAFGLSTNPFVGDTHNIKKIKICFLDKYDTNLAEVNNELENLENYHNPNPPSLTEKDQAEFKAASDSLLCRYQAQKIGIKKLPAIVFDKKNVIYGELDINRASNDYQTYKESQNG